MSNDETSYMSISELVGAFKANSLTPSVVTEHFLERIRSVDPQIHAFATVTSRAALQAARESTDRYSRGAQLSPIDGIAVGYKDMVDTQGIVTAAGSKVLANRIPTKDALVVSNLKSKGVVSLGKLNMHEFGFGSPESDGLVPPARNPWNRELVPGGSSSGAGAALAAGLCTGAIGGDTGGSIRIPSSYCGVVGMKPTAGLVGTDGVVPLSWTLEHIGPMARSVEDVAQLLEAMTASTMPSFGMQASSLTGAKLRVGSPDAYVADSPRLSKEVADVYSATLRVLEEGGAEIVPVELPDHDFGRAVYVTIVAAEAYALHERLLLKDAPSYGPKFLGRLLEGCTISATEYLTALRGRTLICRMLSEVMATVDIVVLPTTPTPATSFALEFQSERPDPAPFTWLFNLTGQPAISVPVGFSADGLPLGAQIVGPPGRDCDLLAVAATIDNKMDWSKHRPSVGTRQTREKE